MKKFLIFLLTSLLISSCSIQKRQHLPGYHITYHKNYKTTTKDLEKNDLSDSEEIIEQNQTNETIDLANSESKPQFNIDELIKENDEYIQINLSELNHQFIANNKKLSPKLRSKSSSLLHDLKFKKIKWKTKKSSYEKTDEERAENLALTGFILSLAFLILGPFGIFTSIAALIICNIALSRLGPDAKYRILAKVGSIISIVFLSLIILTIVLILTLFSYSWY